MFFSYLGDVYFIVTHAWDLQPQWRMDPRRAATTLAISRAPPKLQLMYEQTRNG